MATVKRAAAPSHLLAVDRLEWAAALGQSLSVDWHTRNHHPRAVVVACRVPRHRWSEVFPVRPSGRAGRSEAVCRFHLHFVVPGVLRLSEVVRTGEGVVFHPTDGIGSDVSGGRVGGDASPPARPAPGGGSVAGGGDIPLVSPLGPRRPPAKPPRAPFRPDRSPASRTAGGRRLTLIFGAGRQLVLVPVASGRAVVEIEAVPLYVARGWRQPDE